MADRKVLATMVLVAGLPGRMEIASRLATALDECVDGGGVVAEPADGEPVSPIPEQDWEIRFVVVNLSDTLKVSGSPFTLGPPPPD